MCGLSARTYSWGGEGSRFAGGDWGDSFLKYLVMPTGLSTSIVGDSSSEGGAEDREERSEPERDMMEGRQVHGSVARGLVLSECALGSGGKKRRGYY